jgi:multisite-specific tRNA:(cytosine-C5)-methyltransferase
MAPLRIMLISDTHGETLDYSKLPPVDVAIHCGDLTEESKLEEFRTAVTMIQKIPATVKLVIAGNHDFTLDEATFRQKLATADLDPDLVRETYGDFGEAEHLLTSVPDITYLREGTHQISLENHAPLTVYASPFTASKSDWGFTYDLETDHQWNIQTGTDIVITHSPPRGILDMTNSRQRAGSASLFAAVACARPKLHCFGHIHEGWGGKRVQWRQSIGGATPTHFTAIDGANSRTLVTLASMARATQTQDEEGMGEEEVAKHRKYQEQGYVDVGMVEAGKAAQTLFVNAAVESLAEDLPPHLPWIVEIDHPLKS